MNTNGLVHGFSWILVILCIQWVKQLNEQSK